MNPNSFAKDMIVSYHNIQGPIKYISSSYVTICINSHLPKSKQTNILVYRIDWKYITSIKDSQK